MHPTNNDNKLSLVLYSVVTFTLMLQYWLFYHSTYYLLEHHKRRGRAV